jgi:subtilisin family serine protease
MAVWRRIRLWVRRLRPRRGPTRVAEDRLAAQTQVIVKAVGRDSVEQDPEGNYLFQRDHILVREEYLRPVRDILERLGKLPERDAPTAQPRAAGVRLVRLTSGPGLSSTLETLRIIRSGGDALDGGPIDGLGTGVAAPNHYVSIADVVGRCPAKEPTPTKSSRPEPHRTMDVAAGRGVRVVVVDTGLDPHAPKQHRWMRGVTGDRDPTIRPNGTLDEYAGHGTFIAGVVRCMAPKAEVFVKAAFHTAGASPELDLINALDEVLEQDSPDIISLSAGTRTFAGAGLLGLTTFNETRLSQHKGVVLVAAAGNDESRVPFWPAASPFTISVGALNKGWNARAKFSNHGGWVDVYAPGEDLVNAFPIGEYVYREPPNTGKREHFGNLAKWSGTSFSTPLVAGLIAARMSHTGENGRDAASALLEVARSSAQLGVGAVLFPK